MARLPNLFPPGHAGRKSFFTDEETPESITKTAQASGHNTMLLLRESCVAVEELVNSGPLPLLNPRLFQQTLDADNLST